MPALAESDYRSMLEVLRVAGSVDDPLAFPPPVLRALRDLVPSDVVAFHEGGTRPGRVLVYAGDPLGPMTADVRAARRRLRHEDPLGPAAGAQRLSDRVSMREFRRRDFYQLVHRPLGVEYVLQLYLDPERTDARLEFDRLGPDFEERDRRVLDLLLPHLRQFLHAARRRGPAAAGASKLTAREREVLEHVARGSTNGEVARALGISPETVRKHLENAYAKLGVHTRTGAVAALRG